MAKAPRGVSTPKAVRKDWSKLDIPDARVCVVARIDGCQEFTIGWEASRLAEVFAKITHESPPPRNMDWRAFRASQEDIRQKLMASPSDEEISHCAAFLAYLGFLRVPVNHYEDAVKEIQTHKDYYIHVIYLGNQWVFFGAIKEVSDETLMEIMGAAYPTKFSTPEAAGTHRLQ